MASYKKLLLGASYKTKFGNCMLQSDMPELLILPKDVFYDKENDESDLEVHLECLSQPLSEYKINVLNYISGFIMKQALSSLTCFECRTFLKNAPKVVEPFLTLKDRGGLTVPCVEVQTIVTYTNRVVEPILNGGNLTISSLSTKVLRKVLDLLIIRNVTILNQVDDHVDVLLYKSHRLTLIEFVVNKFVCMRMRHFAKSFNDSLKKNNVRKKFTKLVHFNNQ